MQRARFKILLVGQGRGVPRQLSSLLADAGYEIARGKRTPEQKRAARALAALVSDGATFTAELASAGPRTRGRSASHRRQGSPTLPVTLRALRESVGRTQGEVANRVSMTQPQLSRVEARRDHLISTVRKYVRALDGRIEVAAIVNGSRFVLRDI